MYVNNKITLTESFSDHKPVINFFLKLSVTTPLSIDIHYTRFYTFGFNSVKELDFVTQFILLLLKYSLISNSKHKWMICLLRRFICHSVHVFSLYNKFRSCTFLLNLLNRRFSSYSVDHYTNQFCVSVCTYMYMGFYDSPLTYLIFSPYYPCNRKPDPSVYSQPGVDVMT